MRLGMLTGAALEARGGNRNGTRHNSSSFFSVLFDFWFCDEEYLRKRRADASNQFYICINLIGLWNYVFDWICKLTFFKN